MSQRHMILALSAIVALFGVAAVTLGAASTTATVTQPVTPAVQLVAAAATPRQVPQNQAQVQLSFAPVVKAVTPSVVNVYATTRHPAGPARPSPTIRSSSASSAAMIRSRAGPAKSQSLGSGVIVDAAGVILTNSHVVDGATDIRIATERRARISGRPGPRRSQDRSGRAARSAIPAARASRRSPLPIPTRWKSAISCSPSATRSASARP